MGTFVFPFQSKTSDLLISLLIYAVRTTCEKSVEKYSVLSIKAITWDNYYTVNGSIVETSKYLWYFKKRKKKVFS